MPPERQNQAGLRKSDETSDRVKGMLHPLGVIKHNHAISCPVNIIDHNRTVSSLFCPILYLLDLFRIIVNFLYILSILNKDNLMTVAAAVVGLLSLTETWKDGRFSPVINWKQ